MIREPGDLPSDNDREAGRGAPAAAMSSDIDPWSAMRPETIGAPWSNVAAQGFALSETVPQLHVCTTCRAGEAVVEGEPVPGRRLFDALAGLIDAAGPVELREVVCLASCERGCAVAISAPGKWGYLLGGLSVPDAADLLRYGAAYAASRTGTIMPSKRPASLAQSVLGRFPASEMP
ncbi:MAG: hypothetical protein NVSMB18_32450 [Acetobacteraceae bacterium]